MPGQVPRGRGLEQKVHESRVRHCRSRIDASLVDQTVVEDANGPLGVIRVLATGVEKPLEGVRSVAVGVFCPGSVGVVQCDPCPHR